MLALVARCLGAAILTAVGVMLLAVGSILLGAVITLGATVWLLQTVRRM